MIKQARLQAGPSLDPIALLDSLNPRLTENTQVPPDDPRIKSETVDFASPAGSGRGQGLLLRASRRADSPGVVLVVHENRGLNPHIKGVARSYDPTAAGLAWQRTVQALRDRLAPGTPIRPENNNPA